MNKLNLPGVELAEALPHTLPKILVGAVILAFVVIINLYTENRELKAFAADIDSGYKTVMKQRFKDGSTFASKIHPGTASLFKFKTQTIVCAVLDEHKYSPLNKDR